MLKLYAVMLGGSAQKSNIELHDIVFAVGKSLEDIYPKLVNKWFGITAKLHIDNAIELSHVNGYDIIISDKKTSSNAKQLYCINFGGYKEGFFGELHEVGFYIAESEDEAKKNAFNNLCVGTIKQHCDNKLLVTDKMNSQSRNLIDDVLLLEQVDEYYINLQLTDVIKPLKLEKVNYLRLDTPEILAIAASQLA